MNTNASYILHFKGHYPFQNLFVFSQLAKKNYYCLMCSKKNNFFNSKLVFLFNFLFNL